MTEKYQELLSLQDFSRASDDGVGAEHSVSRMTLRQVLLTGLEDAVQFDKKLTHYHTKQDATVTVTADFHKLVQMPDPTTGFPINFRVNVFKNEAM
ncbi:hypothetical protein E5D57_007250 [Metarhizium anisopliae]|nr:hypothetical protein E5D57_007250 [Metarhizium anisopliae]